MDNRDSIYVERNGVYNHWGIWVNPNEPITGVISNNECIQFISDELYNGINLDWEEHIKSDPHTKEFCEICEYWEDYPDSTWLIGDWLIDDDGLYYPDPNGEYAAIVRESVTQVVFSQYTSRSALCSPCFPGQGDLDTIGEFLTYNLPPEAFDWVD